MAQPIEEVADFDDDPNIADLNRRLAAAKDKKRKEKVS